MKILALILLFASISPVFSQSRKIDSLKALLPEKDELKRANIYLELAWGEGLTDKTRIKYANEALMYAISKKDTAMMVSAVRVKAWTYRHLNKVDSANRISMQILPMARKMSDDYELAKLLNGLTVGHFYTAQYNLALRLGLEGEDHALRSNNEEIVASLANNVGLIYYKLHDHPKALSYFRKALIADERADFLPGVYVNMSLCYSIIGKLDSAKFFLTKTVAHPSFNNNFMPSYLYATAKFHIESKRYDSALVFLKECWSTSEKANDLRHVMSAADDFIFLQNKHPQPDSDRYWLRKCEKVAASSGFNYEAIQLYEDLGHYHLSHQNKDKALFYFERYADLKDSMYGATLTNGLLSIEADFLEQKKNKQIFEQQIKLVASARNAQHQILIAAVAVAIALLLAALTYILYRHKRQKEIVNEMLDEKIKIRTREFGDCVSKLRREFNEYQQTTIKQFNTIRHHMATLDGLNAIHSDCSGEERKQLSDNIFRIRQYLQGLPS